MGGWQICAPIFARIPNTYYAVTITANHRPQKKWQGKIKIASKHTIKHIHFFPMVIMHRERTKGTIYQLNNVPFLPFPPKPIPRRESHLAPPQIKVRIALPLEKKKHVKRHCRKWAFLKTGSNRIFKTVTASLFGFHRFLITFGTLRHLYPE